MNGDVDGGKGFVRTVVNSVDIMMHESTSREIQMDRYSGSGRPTCPPSQVFPSGFFSPDGEERAFVPITAAGQRGLFTPLPHIHSVLKNEKRIEHKMSRVN
jgi:hypothetical protein